MPVTPACGRVVSGALQQNLTYRLPTLIFLGGGSLMTTRAVERLTRPAMTIMVCFLVTRRGGLGYYRVRFNSMAAMTIVGDYLYALGYTQLIVMDISDELHPLLIKKIELNWAIETVYPHDDNHLLVGSRNGLYIFDISNPHETEEIGRFSHFTACDPVVSHGNLAYVTLRSNNECDGFSNHPPLVPERY